MSINPNMELWLHELETTNKPQARGILYRGEGSFDKPQATEGFCCLGIACEVAIDNGVDVGGDRYDEYGYDGDSSDYYMPVVAAEWLGLTGDQQCECVEMNDDDRLTFPEIAARLRKEMA